MRFVLFVAFLLIVGSVVVGGGGGLDGSINFIDTRRLTTINMNR